MSNYSDKGEATREFYRRQGELCEHERIISLAENIVCDTNNECDHASCWGINLLIRKIRGLTDDNS